MFSYSWLVSLFPFVFAFFCFRRAPSVTRTSQTSAPAAPDRWLIDWPSSRHGHASVSLTVTHKKRRRNRKTNWSVTVSTERPRKYINDNHDTNPSLIPKKKTPPNLFHCYPPPPMSPSLDIRRYRHARNSHLVWLSVHELGLRAL